MSRTSSTSFLPTPCPIGPPRRASFSILSQQDDTTTNIEYTRALDPSLHVSKPRRRSSILPGQQPARKATQQVTIFEDIEEDQEMSAKSTQPKIQGSTLLCKPARRVAMAGESKVSAHQQTSRLQTSGPGPARGGLREIGQAPARAPLATEGPRDIGTARARRVSGLHGISQPRSRASLAPNAALLGGRSTLGPDHGHREGSVAPPASTMKGSIKEAAKRRMTIYAPDDTTVMTLHPSANNPYTIDDTFYMPNAQAPTVSNKNDGEIIHEDRESNLHKPIRRPRKSLMAAPKRIPFQYVDNFGNTEAFDVCGDNTGKENVPPGGYDKFKAAVANPPEERHLRNASLCQPTAASRARQSILPRDAVPLRNRPRSARLTPSPKADKRTTPPKAPLGVPNRPRANPELREAIAQKRSQLDASKLKQYPVLTENFTQLSLFENDWLSNQEVAITEIINEIFKTTPAKPPFRNSGKGPRTMLFETYDVPEVAMLHSRLQASLLYGALSAPASLTSKLKIDHDLGLRKRYITLLLESYTEESLRFGVEVVVGRQIRTEPSTPATSMDVKAGRRELVAFIETFFVRVSDIDGTDGGESSDLDRWRKAMLRTLMLIWILDHGKTAGAFTGNLFKTTSVHKSSTAVLRALANMLLHSGDIIRALKQMNYEVSHVQDPLDEIKYHIDNLAVDLRDGVFLTRLVEILLHCRPTTGMRGSYDETIIVTLPDTTELISNVFDADLSRSQNVLTQHLKLPCISETQKIFNVNIALSALQYHGVHGQNVVGDMVAKDIVDGHREKTMSFLWQLVSTFGLHYLVDWKVLAKDIGRLSGQPYAFQSNEPHSMLLEWAAAHSKHKTITNLSTDFMDGKAYVEILNSFACYLSSLGNDEGPNTSKILEHQLQVLGCSEAFKKQLTSAIDITVPSRETTISNLAFLASRLLPIMQQHEAAKKIQKFWRAKNFIGTMKARMPYVKVARECASFAHARNREMDAAVVLQRAWRGVVARRLEQWQRDVAAFQVIARGFLAKKRSQRKVLGGW